MKAVKKKTGAGKALSTALVANGSAGAWTIDIDESLSGPQRWFLQIEGPACFLYSEISRPRAVAEISDFLNRCLSDRATARDGNYGLELETRGLHSLELLWDGKPADRCFILLRGGGELSLRVALPRHDAEAVRDALEHACKELRDEGLLDKTIT